MTNEEDLILLNQASQSNTAQTPLQSFRQQRRSAKGNITRIKNGLDNIGNERNAIELECKLDVLNSYIKQIIAIQTEIEKLSPEDDRRGEIEDLCIATKSKLLTLLGRNRPRDSTAFEATLAMPPPTRLPNLKLPVFDGKYAEYKNFRSSFNSLVHDEPTLSPIEKFNHLLSCLSGDALRTVKAFQVIDDNYIKALDRLEERYDKKSLIFFDSIDQIFDIPKMAKPNASELRKAVDTVSAIYDSLLSLGSEKDITNALIIQIVLSKVDPSTQARWNEQLDYSTLPTWEHCSKVLIRRCQALEINDSGRDKPDNISQNNNNKSKPNWNNKKPSNRSSLTCVQDNAQKKCLYCQSSDHQIYYCNSFTSLQIAQRFNFVKANALCLNCLKPGHSVAKCRSSRCRTCRGLHHTLLHRQEPSSQQSSLTNSELPSSSTNTCSNLSVGQSAVLHANSSNDVVILATALIQLKDKFGNYHLARAMLDSGSQLNFITDECVNRLKLIRSGSNLQISGIGELNTSVAHKTSTIVKSRINDHEFVADFHIIKSISSFQPEENISISNWDIPANLILADPHFHKRQKVDLLIGADVFFDLLCIGQIKLGESLPILQKTLLGWIVSGKFAPVHNSIRKCFYTVNETISFVDIDNTLKRFWQIDELPNTVQKLPEEHQDCENHFTKNLMLLPTGNFQVRLPFKIDTVNLRNSFDIAKHRYLSLERRLMKSPDIQILYHEFMKEYLNLSHMSPTDNIDLREAHYFIPHQCVYRPDSVSTKLRVVFDASSRTSSQLSLNDTLMVGPTIQPDLYTILLQFRCKKYAINADITKMYRQVFIHEADRKYQLILWREHTDQPIQIFQLNTVTYGTSSAPFLAIRCLKELSNKYKETVPLGAKVIDENFYVDDLLSGGDDLEEVEKIRNEVTHILETAGFKLAKWYSNHKYYNESNAEKSLQFNSSDTTKTLGLKWIPNTDNFMFNLPKDFIDLKPTKRNILSTTARLFDPLGLLCPVIIRAKILLQELWLNKLDWDESIPINLHTCWSNFKDGLQHIEKFYIPRYINTSSKTKVDIHGFSDASIRAYGCCIYVCTKTDGNIISTLLTAKSKVAPLKTKTLPRLELCAAHLLTKLWKQIEPILSSYIDKVTFWTDSEIVLHWLKMHPSSLNTFVGNRISEMQEWSTSAEWRHVPTKSNPADLVSRGCSIEDLLSSNWLHGPEFLKKNSIAWPVNKHFEMSSSDELLEAKKVKPAFTVSKLENHFIVELIERCSSYIKIIRAIAYVYRFILPTKSYETLQLTSTELQWSFLKVVSTLQHCEFESEIKAIEKSDLLKPYLQKLTPFLQNYEQDGRKLNLLRVGGRLLNANMDYDTKCPLLLPKNSKFVYLYMTHLHLTNYHCGPKILVGLLRQKIWITNVREVARKVVRRCLHCFRYKPKLSTQIMGNLPTDRLQHVRPFFITGVDFCGPIYTSYRIRGRPPYKTYIAIFVCFSSKAVHIEPASDLTTNTFILLLKRFIGRRGLPSKIYCDNATNFVGASSELQELKRKFFDEHNQNQLQNFVANQGIEFVFIPPRAPHFGGLWEAAVKSTKNLMVRTIANANLTFEELSTILVEIEAILNSRPIAPLSQDPNDGEAITPAHLLIGSSLKAIPENSIKVSTAPPGKRYQIISGLKSQFWRAFQRDYLLEQQQRNKWCNPQRNIQIGDMVIVKEDNLPPLKWMLGRITEVFTGADGAVRVACIKTISGVIKRVIQKLAVLPMNAPEDVLKPC